MLVCLQFVRALIVQTILWRNIFEKDELGTECQSNLIPIPVASSRGQDITTYAVTSLRAAITPYTVGITV